jgi:hypothetical protein
VATLDDDYSPMKSVNGDDLIMDVDETSGAVNMYPKSAFNPQHTDEANAYKNTNNNVVTNLADYESSDDEAAPPDYNGIYKQVDG